MYRLKQVKYLIIHHTVSGKATTVGQVRNWHKARGFQDIGYHWLINNKGTWKGRDEQWVGAHCRGGSRNFDSLGIAVAGNFEKEEFYHTQFNHLVNLLTSLCKKYNLSPDKIYTHRDFASTLCPGKHLYEYLPALREGVKEELELTPKPKLMPIGKPSKKLIPLFKLRYPNSNHRYYTTSASERKGCVERWKFIDEGILGFIYAPEK